MRPGEKLFEEISTSHETATDTKYNKILALHKRTNLMRRCSWGRRDTGHRGIAKKLEEVTRTEWQDAILVGRKEMLRARAEDAVGVAR